MCVVSLIGAMLCIRSLVVWNHWCYASCAVSAGMEPLFLCYMCGLRRYGAIVLCYVCGLHWYGAIGAMLYVCGLHWYGAIGAMCVVSTGLEPLFFAMLYVVHVSHVFLLCGFCGCRILLLILVLCCVL